MQYTIRKAMQADVPAVAGIYDRILLKEEAGQVTIGWLRGVYPTEQTACAALAADDLFVMEADGVICATARINQVQVPEYRNADWRYADVPENEIMVLHTLVVDPLCAGGGFGTAFVSFYEQYAKAPAGIFAWTQTLSTRPHAGFMQSSAFMSPASSAACSTESRM